MSYFVASWNCEVTPEQAEQIDRLVSGIDPEMSFVRHYQPGSLVHGWLERPNDGTNDHHFRKATNQWCVKIANDILKVSVVSDVVMARLSTQVQRIHIPWPMEALGVYGTRKTGDREMDAWVTSHVPMPEGAEIRGICPGRAYREKELVPCIVVTAGAPALFGSPTRDTWADGRAVTRG